MKAMLAGFAAIVVISVGAWLVLERAGFSSQDVYSSQNVRLD
ncbi:hypothetical protein [Aliishimia ponticola]|nr:hypothetical protein [Aliishimia ponticola]